MHKHRGPRYRITSHSITERVLTDTCSKCTKMHSNGQSDAVDGVDWLDTGFSSLGTALISPVANHLSLSRRVRRDQLLAEFSQLRFRKPCKAKCMHQRSRHSAQLAAA